LNIGDGPNNAASVIGLRDKLDRYRSGKKLRVLDLFAGCGGFSLGFHRAGFEIVGGVEIDPHAAMTHAINFHGVDRAVETDPRFVSDISTMEPGKLTLNGKPHETDVDIIIGGPPCQAYARVGRAKLREVNNHPEAFRIDPRGNLYLRYLAYVSHLRPLAIVMENVPDALNYGGHNVAQEVADVLSQMGYDCEYTILNSVFYGVPQLRDRMFLIAYRRELGVCIRFPKPTHYFKLPRGYETSRGRLDSIINSGGLFESTHCVEPPTPGKNQTATAVKARDALEDLPRLTSHLRGGNPRGARKLNKCVAFPKTIELSDYAIAMRSWPGFEALNGTDAHVIRSLPRDYRIFEEMKPGDQYPEAHRKAEEIFERELKERHKEGVELRIGTSEYLELRKRFVPPYDPGKFPNKWRKMEADEPARTLLAHLGKDSYTHIHFDSTQARTISVREAARLQSFPDGFQFFGSMNSGFRQIGNAVPPILSWRIAETVKETLNGADVANDLSRRREAS
jgi:DNA (cytosine-5)-methyltransferase 1